MGSHHLSLPDGSSPRAWGIQVPQPGPGTPLRFIPTCVGNTATSSSRWLIASVHPHVRGEYVFFTAFAVGACGSSPRAWGIPRPPDHRPGPRRFIPTCVGNTPVNKGGTGATTVHPHVRGEYSAVAFLSADSSGSSPRAWGIRRYHLVLPFTIRFIPTCVGNTGQPSMVKTSPTVHPHVRGEY